MSCRARWQIAFDSFADAKAGGRESSSQTRRPPQNVRWQALLSSPPQGVRERSIAPVSSRPTASCKALPRLPRLVSSSHGPCILSLEYIVPQLKSGQTFVFISPHAFFIPLTRCLSQALLSRRDYAGEGTCSHTGPSLIS